MSINVVCNVCKKELTVYLDGRLDRIEVDPCQKCLDEAERVGFKKGQEGAE